MPNGRRRFWVPAILLLLFLQMMALAPFPGGVQTANPMEYEAAADAVRIRADYIEYDKEEDVYRAEGDVEIWQGSRKLTADRVVLQGATHEAEATGNVILVQGDDVLRGERMITDLDTSLGVIFQGTLFLKQQNFYLRGEEIERLGENTYRVTKGSFTTCNGDRPAWRFTGNEALVTLEEYASLQGATFQVKNTPILYSPYLVFPLKTQRQSGFLIPLVGYSNLNGFQFNNAYYWAIAKNMDATFYLDLASKKGVGEGVEYRLTRKKDSSTYMYGYNIHEGEAYRAQRTDQLDRKAERWFAELIHEETFAPGFFGKANLNGFSDRQYLKDYGRTYEERSMEQAYSFVSLTKNWERYSLSGEARQTVDLRVEDKTTLQTYPVVNFSGVSRKILETPLYYGFTSTYGYYYREQGTTGQMLDLYPRLTLPLKLNHPYLEVTPELRLRETYFHYRDPQEKDYSRQMWEFYTATATELSRIFDTGWEGVPKIKHIIRPDITYSYIPDVDQGKIPNYSSPVTKYNAVSYGVTQRLIGKVVDKDGNGRYHEYAYLRVSEAVDLFEVNRHLISPSDRRRPFSVITEDLKIFSTQYLRLENNSTYDPNKNRFLTSYTLFNIADSRGDNLSLEHRWEKDISEQVYGGLSAKVSSSLSATYFLRYSSYEKKPLEKIYGINYQKQCWGVNVTYSEIPAVAGNPAERKILFMVNLLGIGSFGTK